MPANELAIWTEKSETSNTSKRNAYLAVVFKPSKVQEARGRYGEFKIQAHFEEPFYQKTAEKNKKINKDESGIKNIGIFLFQL